MTVKEIAEAVNKTERSVRRWAKKASDKMSTIRDKMSASTSTYPSEYTLKETLCIIEIGLGKNAANIYRMNAEKDLNKNIDLVTKSDLKEFAQEIVKATVQAFLPIIQLNQNRLQIEQDYYSILGYVRHKNIKITFSEALKFGKQASRLSREKNIEIRKVPDERYGIVNSYHISILVEVFSI